MSAPHPPEASWRLLVGGARKQLAATAPESIHCVVCSPPYYQARSYGAPRTWGGRPGCDHDWTPIAVRDAHGDDGGGRLEGGHRGQRATRGDRVSTLCAACDAWKGELGHERTPQEYVEHLVEVFREVRRVLRPDGTCFIVIGDSYPGSSRQLADVAPKQLGGVPERLGLGLQADGWVWRQTFNWVKPNAHPDPAPDRGATDAERVLLLSRGPHYFFDPRDRLGFRLQQTWSIPTRPSPSGHPAPFPLALAEQCVRAATPDAGCCAACGTPWRFPTRRGSVEPAGPWAPSCACGTLERVPAVVLDPFAGSGTTLLAALRLGRSAVGVDLNSEFVEMARERLRKLTEGTR